MKYHLIKCALCCKENPRNLVLLAVLLSLHMVFSLVDKYEEDVFNENKLVEVIISCMSLNAFGSY